MKRLFVVYDASGKLIRTLSTHGDPSSSLENGEYSEEVESLDGIAFAPIEIDTNAQSVADVRSLRNKLLSSSDWTQVSDAPVDRDAWAAYRQALRDITKQQGFPNEVVWPEPPVAKP